MHFSGIGLIDIRTMYLAVVVYLSSALYVANTRGDYTDLRRDKRQNLKENYSNNPFLNQASEIAWNPSTNQKQQVWIEDTENIPNNHEQIQPNPINTPFASELGVALPAQSTWGAVEQAQEHSRGEANSVPVVIGSTSQQTQWSPDVQQQQISTQSTWGIVGQTIGQPAGEGNSVTIENAATLQQQQQSHWSPSAQQQQTPQSTWGVVGQTLGQPTRQANSVIFEIAPPSNTQQQTQWSPSISQQPQSAWGIVGQALGQSTGEVVSSPLEIAANSQQVHHTQWSPNVQQQQQQHPSFIQQAIQIGQTILGQLGQTGLGLRPQSVLVDQPTLPSIQSYPTQTNLAPTNIQLQQQNVPLMQPNVPGPPLAASNPPLTSSHLIQSSNPVESHTWGQIGASPVQQATNIPLQQPSFSVGSPSWGQTGTSSLQQNSFPNAPPQIPAYGEDQVTEVSGDGLFQLQIMINDVLLQIESEQGTRLTLNRIRSAQHQTGNNTQYVVSAEFEVPPRKNIVCGLLIHEKPNVRESVLTCGEKSYRVTKFVKTVVESV